jgi:hypothetical protein
MDPNKVLEEARAAARYLLSTDFSVALGDGHIVYDDLSEGVNAAQVLAERLEALDGWLSRGGFLPEAWRGGR